MKCYTCNKEVDKVEVIVNRQLCKECANEVHKVLNMIKTTPYMVNKNVQ